MPKELLSHLSLYDFTSARRGLPVLLGHQGGGHVVVDNLLYAAAGLNFPTEVITNLPAEIHWSTEINELQEEQITHPYLQLLGNPGRVEFHLTDEFIRGDPPKILTDKNARNLAVSLLAWFFRQPERLKAVVVAHHYLAGVLASVAKQITDFPLVYIPHNLHLFTDVKSWAQVAAPNGISNAEFFTKYFTVPFRRCNLFVVPTQAEISIFRERFSDSQGGSSLAPFLDYTVHIPWGVDHQIFNPRLQKRENKAMVRDWLGIPRDALIFGFSGRIVPVKNIEAIIDAFAALTEKYPEKNIYFAVFGGNREDFTDENSYSYSLLNRIQKKNINELSEKIKFFGVYFPQTIMSAIDILVQPSFYESWGLAVTEAMACGIPVIVSDNPIMKEVTKNGQRYIDPSDASSLERAMEEFLLSPDLRQELGNNAYEDTLDYNWSNSFLTLIEHIRKFGLS